MVIDGAAKPQGSKNGFVRNGRVVMVEASKGLKELRAHASAIIHRTAYENKWVMPDKDAGVDVNIVYTFTRPKSALKRVFHTVKPDIDKLTRFTLDAVTQAGNVWHDDSQVVALHVHKIYGNTNATNLTITYGARE